MVFNVIDCLFYLEYSKVKIYHYLVDDFVSNFYHLVVIVDNDCWYYHECVKHIFYHCHDKDFGVKHCHLVVDDSNTYCHYLECDSVNT